MALPFVLHDPLCGLPNPIISIDPIPNSCLIFKIHLKFCCVACMLDIFQQQCRASREGKIRNGLTVGLDTNSREVSQGRDQIPNLQVQGTGGARGQEAQELGLRHLSKYETPEIRMEFVIATRQQLFYSLSIQFPGFSRERKKGG